MLLLERATTPSMRWGRWFGVVVWAEHPGGSGVCAGAGCGAVASDRTPNEETVGTHHRINRSNVMRVAAVGSGVEVERALWAVDPTTALFVRKTHRAAA
jgi:hypothetical protein